MYLRRLSFCAALLHVVIGLGLMLVGGCSDPAGPDHQWAEDPVQPAGQRVVGVTQSYQTTCAHTDNGLLFCWGENRFGEFGNSTLEPSSAPVPAAGGMQWRHVFGSIGTPQMCGVTADDVAYCWGYNLNGELGDGTTQDRTAPTPVSGQHRFRAIASAYHTCGLSLSDQVLCWGSDLGGQLGNGSEHSGPYPNPTPVATSQTYTAVTNGMQFSCALRPTGEADCWGWGVGLGSGPGDRNEYYPTPVSGGRRYARISAGEEWVCALDTRGAPFCWGNAGSRWPEDFRSEPEAVPTDLRFRELVSGGRYGACALTEEGEAYCWGGREEPLLVPGRHRWAGIAIGQQAFCGYTPGGSAYCWEWALVQMNGRSQWVLTEPERIPALPA